MDPQYHHHNNVTSCLATEAGSLHVKPTLSQTDMASQATDDKQKAKYAVNAGEKKKIHTGTSSGIWALTSSCERNLSSLESISLKTLGGEAPSLMLSSSTSKVRLDLGGISSPGKHQQCWNMCHPLTQQCRLSMSYYFQSLPFLSYSLWNNSPMDTDGNIHYQMGSIIIIIAWLG